MTANILASREKGLQGVGRIGVWMPEIIKSMTSLLGVPITREAREGCKRTQPKARAAATALNHFYPLHPLCPHAPKPPSLFGLPSIVKVACVDYVL